MDNVVSRDVVVYLRDLILGGRYEPGQRIRQEEVAEELGVSRIPVREAFHVLESEGLVTLEPRRGARIPVLERFEFEQIYRLREVVEPLAIRESLDNLTADQIERLHDLAEEMASGLDVESFLRLDREFHLLSYSGAPFNYITKLVQQFWNSTQHYRRHFTQNATPEQLEKTHADHRMLVAAIRQRNHTVSSAVVQAHLNRTREQLSDVFGRGNGVRQSGVRLPVSVSLRT